MARQATSLVVRDLSSFTRSLSRALAEQTAPPGHVQLQNLIARAAGFRNLQALKAAGSAPVDDSVPVAPTAADGGSAPAPALSENAKRTLAQFDAKGRLLRWPTKFTVQRMAMWALWMRFEAKRLYTEREVNAILRGANAFGDHVTLRRELVNHQLLARKPDCSQYWKLPARPDPEVRALLAAWRARHARRPGASRGAAPADDHAASVG